MVTHSESISARLEQLVTHFFSPNGLMTVVALIVLSVVLLSGGSVDRRTVDHRHATTSPILDTAR